jgi:hypothetical protein
MAAGALIAGASWNTARAQPVPEGRVYAFHSNPDGTCPTLDWHLVTGPGGELSGMISWDGMKSMAHVTGTIGPDRTFKLTAREVGGQRRTATVTGDAKNDGWLLINILGPKVDCKDIKVPIWNRSGTQSGGGG